MWTLKCIIIYKQLLLHRHLMISDDNYRAAKAILSEQKKYEINDGLMSEMMLDADDLNNNLDVNLQDTKTKNLK